MKDKYGADICFDNDHFVRSDFREIDTDDQYFSCIFL